MRFEWDDAKDEINQKKHGVAFEVASRVFADPNVLEYIERVVEGEERWHAIGFASGTVLFLTVVHTHVGDKVVRIISAREATSRERKLYADSVF